jgi:peptide/nickel transport system substrate-binding protein
MPDPAFLTGRTNRRTLLRSLVVVLGSVGVAACSSAGNSASPAATAPRPEAPSAQPTPAPPRTTLTVAVSRDLANGEQDPYFMHTSLLCHEPLIGLDDALAPTPRLAEKWTLSEDGLTWTFVLRQGVKFGDGTLFDADAAIRNLQRFMQISPRTSPYTAMIAPVAFGPVADLHKQDAQTFQIVHSSPYPLLEATMSNFFSAMFSPASFAPNGDFNGIPATTGPWRLTAWQRGQSLVLERNDAYWGRAPALQKVSVRLIPDANTRVSALIAGEVDAIVELGALLPALAKQLQTQPEFVVGADLISITQYLHFNCGRPPFDDVRLRQAVGLALDRESIARDLVLGFGDPGRSLLSPLSTRWFSTRGTPRFDPAEARRQATELLGGQRVEAVFPFSGSAGQARPYKQIAEYLQATLRPLGVELKLQQLEDAALTDAVNHGEWSLRFSQLGWANGDPDFILGNFLSSQGAANTTSRGAYHNDEVDRLIAAGRQERDQTKRFAVYERLQDLAAQEVPTLALYHERAPYAYKRGLTGLRQRANFQPTFDEARWTPTPA